MRINRKISILVLLCTAGFCLPSLCESDLPELPKTDAVIKELLSDEPEKTVVEMKTEETVIENENNKVTEIEEEEVIEIKKDNDTSTNEVVKEEETIIETDETKPDTVEPKKEEKIDPVRIEVSSQRIPTGTSFDIRLNNAINSVSSQIGDEFTASLVSDIIINNNIVLPAGTIVRGTLGKVKKSGLCLREAQILLVFDHIVTPIGKQVPVYAYVTNNSNVNYSGYFVGGTSYGKATKENLQKSKEMIVNSTNWGVDTGKKYLAGVPVILTAPIGAIGGTLGGSGYFVGKSIYNAFNKGNNVYVDKDSLLHVTLSRDLDVPVN